MIVVPSTSGLRLNINTEAVSVICAPLTVGQLIDHYRESELCATNSKTLRTKDVYEHQLTNVIGPRWGSHRLKDVKPIAVEAWLNSMPLAPGTRYKTKGVLSILFQHAMRYEWTTSNPIRLVRQSAIPQQEEIVLIPVEIAALPAELRNPFHALIQVEGPPKTLASRRPVPMSSELASSLRSWIKQTSYSGAKDWVFASPSALGKKPYWSDAVLKRHVLPAAERAGISKRIGWHSFRRTLATLLQSSGASVKTTQELLRHSSPVMTLGIHARR